MKEENSEVVPCLGIAVRATFGHARHHRQHRLLAIECLDLALLIDAEDEGSVWRGKIKADYIAYLVDEQRVVRQLERLTAVRLQAERRPHPADRGVLEKPSCAAIERIDQCVASTGVVRNVCSITKTTSSSSIVRRSAWTEPRQADHRSDPSKNDDATCSAAWGVIPIEGTRRRTEMRCRDYRLREEGVNQRKTISLADLDYAKSVRCCELSSRPVHNAIGQPAGRTRSVICSAAGNEDLVLVEENLMRTELDQRRAAEDELREEKEFILAYVERVEELRVIEAETRKAMEFWRLRSGTSGSSEAALFTMGWHYPFRLKGRLVALGAGKDAQPRLVRIITISVNFGRASSAASGKELNPRGSEALGPTGGEPEHRLLRIN